MTIKRTYYQDKHNVNKTWEVSKLKGGYYLRQFINGKQFKRGVKTSKRFIKSIGIFDFKEITKE